MATLTIIDAAGVTVNHVDPSRSTLKLPTYGQWLHWLTLRGHALRVNETAVHGMTIGQGEAMIDSRGNRQHNPKANIPVLVSEGRSRTITLPHATPHVLADGSTACLCLGCGLLTCLACGMPGVTEDATCCTSTSLEPTDRAMMKAALASASPKITTLQRATMRLALQRPKSRMSAITVGCRVRMEDTEQEVEWEKTIRTIPKPVSKTGLACRACVALFLDTIKATAVVNKEREHLAAAYRQVILKDERDAHIAAFDEVKRQGHSDAIAREVAQSVLVAHQREVAKQHVRIPGALAPILDVTDEVKDTK